MVPYFEVCQFLTPLEIGRIPFQRSREIVFRDRIFVKKMRKPLSTTDRTELGFLQYTFGCKKGFFFFYKDNYFLSKKKKLSFQKIINFSQHIFLVVFSKSLGSQKVPPPPFWGLSIDFHQQKGHKRRVPFVALKI